MLIWLLPILIFGFLVFGLYQPGFKPACDLQQRASRPQPNESKRLQAELVLARQPHGQPDRLPETDRCWRQRLSRPCIEAQQDGIHLGRHADPGSGRVQAQSNDNFSHHSWRPPPPWCW